MKTRLLEDLDESGSAPAAQPAAFAAQAPAPPPAPAPAVPAARSPGMQPLEPAPQPALAADPVPAVPGTETRPQETAAAGQDPDWLTEILALEAAAGAGQAPAPAFEPATPQRVEPELAPQPALPADPVPADPGTEARPQETAAAGHDPDWLTEILALEAALNEPKPQARRRNKRLVAWGAAGVLLALVAGAGAWLYEQNQVENALVVVANTAPAAPATREPVRPAAPANAVVPAPRADTEQAPGDAQPGKVAQPAGETQPDRLVQSTKDAQPVNDAQPVKDAQPASDAQAAPPPPKPQHRQSRKHPKAETAAAASASGPSARRRREETLIQCRAHGYDARQCMEHECDMTRYGFVCKG